MHLPQSTRRTFISVLGGAAAWPLAARAQQGGRMRRVGALMNLAADDPQSRNRSAAFQEGLQQLGWTDGRNVQIDYRWAAGNAERFRQYAEELVALEPDVILASASPAVVALQRATKTIPIVFVIVIDPVGAGFIASLARPGGNTTGFTLFEYGVAGKWLELLKEIAPGIIRVAVLRDPAIAAGIGQLGAIQAVAPSLNVDLTPIDVREAAEIERGLTEFARAPNGGLVVTGSPSQGIHRKLIVTLAAKYRLPAIYPFRYMAPEGGLLAYGPDQLDQYRRATVYVDRILKGESPADLPVQAPTKYEMAINLKTAKTLGLTVPPTLLIRADEVVE
jgi:putative ABC transport system substrate-binding protein